MTIDQIIKEASYDLTRPEYIDTADAAKMMRPALRDAFPGVKFSVRIERYSGGSSINIHWTDGPATKSVEAITGQYSGGSFDGMIDMEYDWASWLSPDCKHVVLAKSEGTGGSRGSVPAAYGDRPGLDWRLVRFSCKYIHASREISNFANVVQAVCYMLPKLYQADDRGRIMGDWPVDVARAVVYGRAEGETLEEAIRRYSDERWNF